MPKYRISEAADLLGVSDDTVRRWADAGRLQASGTGSGHRMIDGAELAAFASEQHHRTPAEATGPASARNRFRGLVTRVVCDGVMAQVELQCGPFRVVSLMSREAADELNLSPGVAAQASVKSTAVVIELPISGTSRQ